MATVRCFHRARHVAERHSPVVQRTVRRLPQPPRSFVPLARLNRHQHVYAKCALAGPMLLDKCMHESSPIMGSLNNVVGAASCFSCHQSLVPNSGSLLCTEQVL